MKECEKCFSDEQSRELWGEKWTFFWYNAPQIFSWTPDDFEKQASAFHDAGITCVMTFSVTHFRHSFIPWHDQILETIRRICQACHHYGIYVLEHHSCCLGWIPNTPEEESKLRNYMSKHESSPEDFPGLIEHLCGDYTVGAVPVSKMRQISGRTGDRAATQYHGDALCFNNPDYRRAYHAYIDELGEAGVDAILADDMQYFELGNACTCRHCREKFTQETGLELPPPEKWADFFEHFDNPVFLEWLRFKVRTTRNFQKELREHYRRIGLADRWLNYRSSLLTRDTTANAFTSCRDFWDITFQENCFSQLLRVSWPFFHDESLIQYSMAERRNAPSMSLFYPGRYDQYYFSWALAMSWGQLPFLCPEGTNMVELDRRFNLYANAHPELFRRIRKRAEVSFLVSRESFDYTAADILDSVCHPLHGMMQAAYFNHLQSNAIGEEEPVSCFLRQKLVIAAGITRVTQELYEKLLAYVEHGGKLVLFGAFATGTPPEMLKRLLNHPGVIREETPPDPQLDQSDMWIPRLCDNPLRKAEAVDNVFDAVKTQYGALLKKHLVEPPMIQAVSDGYICTLYESKDSPETTLVHLVHIKGILPESHEMVSHDDPIPPFMENAPCNSNPVLLTLSLGLGLQITQVTLYSTEREKALPLAFRNSGGQLDIRIPENVFAGYAVLKITTAR